MSDNDKFLTPGTCSVPECEVVLVVEDKSRLYACKHRLADISKFFLPLLHGDFKEKHMDEIPISDVSKSDLLLFLQCAAEKHPTDLMAIPSDGPSLCTLISLADQFMCQLLKDRVLSHLSTDAMFEAPIATKQAIIETAYLHRDGCVEILEACVRLSAAMEMSEVRQLHTKIGANALAAIYALKVRALQYPSPTVRCVYCGHGHSYGFGYIDGDGLTSLCCPICGAEGSQISAKYSEFKTLLVDKDLLTQCCHT